MVLGLPQISMAT